MLSKGLQKGFGRTVPQGIRGSWTNAHFSSTTSTWRRLERLSPSLGLQYHSPMPIVAPIESARRFASASNVNPQKEYQGQHQEQQQQHDDPRRGGGFCANGFCWFILGFGLLGLVALDQLLQNQQKQEKQRVLNEMQQEANQQNPVPSAWSERNASVMATKYQSKVTEVHRIMDGTLILRDVMVGDVVDVLEEGVGPNADHHLCRCQSRDPKKASSDSNSSGSSIGWYPIKYLEKL